MLHEQASYIIPSREDETVLMTAVELADYLGIGRNRAYELLNKGEIKGFRIGSTWRVSKEAVEKFIYEKSGLR